MREAGRGKKNCRKKMGKRMRMRRKEEAEKMKKRIVMRSALSFLDRYASVSGCSGKHPRRMQLSDWLFEQPV